MVKIFVKYLLVVAVTGDSWPEGRKCDVLLQALGIEGNRLFYTFLDTCTNYPAAVEGLKKQFVPKVNVIAECHNFLKRKQRPNEMISQFLASLRELPQHVLVQ